jgi:hypothetical protein
MPDAHQRSSNDSFAAARSRALKPMPSPGPGGNRLNKTGLFPQGFSWKERPMHPSPAQMVETLLRPVEL